MMYHVGLISLFDVLKFDAWKFTNISATLAHIAEYSKGRANRLMDLNRRAQVAQHIDTVEKTLRDMRSLNISLLCAKQAAKWIAAGENCKFGDLSQKMEELRGTMERELSTMLFMSISSEDRDFYENPEQFGVKVRERFSAARSDIDEAGKCIATDRNTAAVFHLMRVLEIGLNALSGELKISFQNRNWQNIINDIET